MRVLLAIALVATAGNARAAPASPTDLDWLRGQVGDGALAYMVRDSSEIYLAELATGNTVFVADGTHPEFSPDSSKLAWVDDDGSTILGRMRKGDSTVHTIATGASIDGGVHWIANDEVVVLKSGSWYRVKLTGEQQRVDALNALGSGDGECDIKYAGGVWYYVDPNGWATSAGDSGSINGTCSTSLSPDGARTTGLVSPHRTCNLTAVPGGNIADTLQWVYDYSGEKGFDNHRFSSNDGRFVAAQDEKYNFMVIMKVGSTYATRMGSSGSGEMYGDFSVGDGSGDPWPGTAVEPVLQLDRTSLSFVAMTGGSDPDPKDVVVSNSGEATLDTVSTSVDYGSGSGWLQVTRSGSGNAQTLANGVAIGGLSTGTYEATVTVTAANADAARSYTVTLVVSAAPALASIDVVTAVSSVEAGGNVELTATARDQNGDLFAAELAWSVSGGGDMTPAGSAGAVTSHTSTFTSSGALGTFTVRAGSGTVEGIADVTVIQPGAVHIKANCGGAGPAGWQDGAVYALGGADFDFGATFDIAGVTNAAPAEVYETCRHRIRDVETEYGYSFPAEDGSYLVRLHFADGSGPRAIDVWIEGTEVISDLDPSTAAGGTFRALVREVSVTVSDGDGLQITLTDDRASPADFFVNGIEVVGGAAGNQAPLVDAGLDQTVELGRPIFLLGTASDDGVPNATLGVSWSVVDGPGSVTFDDASVLETQATVDAAGAYTLRLTADDGGLRVTDDLSVTVTAPPSIAILSPVFGDVLDPGSTQIITWTTVSLTDVQIDFSSDNGASWQNLAGSVDTEHLDWGAFPWQVPDIEASECLVRVTGYFGEAPTLSGVFTIGAAPPVEEVSDTGWVGAAACSQAPGATLPGLALLLLWWRRQR